MSRFSLPPPGSVRRRLTVWNVGVLACVLLALGVVFRYRLQADSIAAMDRHLSGVAHEVARRVSGPRPPFGGPPFGPPPQGWPPGPPPPDAGPGGLRRFRPRVLDAQGHSLFPHDTDPPWNGNAYRRALRGGEGAVFAMDGGEPIRVYSLPLRRGARVYGVVQTAGSLAPLREAVAQMTRTLLALIPLALIVTAGGGAFLTGRALRPVREITEAAERMEASSLAGRLPVTGTDEFSHLAATFNAMLARLEGAFGQLDFALQQQKRFAADASHELRTPLTIIKANTSLALSGERSPAQYRQALAASDRAADRMTRIVQDLLLLARSDAGQWELPLVPTALGDVLACAAEPLQDGPSITLAPALGGLCVLGDADALTRLFGNLLENAARHTPADGRIAVTAHAESSVVTVSVTDTGEGIAAEHLPHATERFYRADASRARAQGGTGLGLAICLSIVHAHGGTLSLQSEPGQGTTVSVTLPQAAPTSA